MNTIKQAIILAGGFGTRLRSVILEIPKPMAPINDIPFLTYLLSDLHQADFEKVVLAVGYKWEIIQHHFGVSFKGMKLVYSVEHEPLGTGGAIFLATQHCDDTPILVLNGDTMFRVNIEEIAQAYQTSKADIVLALKAMTEFDRYGAVELIENNRINGFLEKKYCKKGVINGGVYCFKKSTLEQLGFEVGQRFSFERDFLEKYVQQLHFQGYISTNYFIDIGIPTDYAKAQVDFKAMEY